MTNSNNDKRIMSLIDYYKALGNNYMKWANWYKRKGKIDQYRHERKQARKNFLQAQRLRRKLERRLIT